MRAHNRPRFRLGTDHVESWFIRANDPMSPRALWLKATILLRRNGDAKAQAWAVVFDGDRTQALCLDVPWEDASFVETSVAGQCEISAGPAAMSLGVRDGRSRGSVPDASGTEQGIAWDLAFERADGSVGEPLALIPALLREAPFVKNKLFTPFPVATFSGSLRWSGGEWDLGGWRGMQGHNWGSAHSREYAWGHCIFEDTSSGASDQPELAVMEATSGRLSLGPVTTPLLSMLVIRRAEREYRFDRVIDVWKQRPDIAFPRWTLTMSGPDGIATLESTGDPARMVCLAYQNPARPTSYCLNSKTAEVTVRVTPNNGAAFELASDHGGALEFLLPDPAGFEPIG